MEFTWKLEINKPIPKFNGNSLFCYATLFDVLFRLEVSLRWRWECGQVVISLSSGIFHVVTQLSALLPGEHLV